MHWMPNPLAAVTVAAAVAVAPVAVAQETVQLTVKVQHHDDPVEAAEVKIEKIGDPTVQFSGVTDYEGLVKFQVPPGTYSYRVDVKGTGSQLTTVELTRPKDVVARFTNGTKRNVDFSWEDMSVAAGSRAAVNPQITGDGREVTVEKMEGPAWAEVFADGTIEVMPPLRTVPGDYTIDVRTSAGQVEKVNVHVTGPETLKALQYPVTSVEQGRSATSAVPMATISHQGRDFSSQPVPEGVKFSTDAPNAQVDAETGRVTLDTAGLQQEAGETVQVPVVAAMPDGKKVTAQAAFHINALPSAKRFTPGWAPIEVAPGEHAAVKQTGERDMPKDAEYWWLRADNTKLAGWRVSIDQVDGTISASPDEGAQETMLYVRVSYSDGSQEQVAVPLKLTEPTAQSGETPAETPRVLPPGKKTEILDAQASEVEIIDNGGVRLDVDKATGKVIATVPEDAMRGASYEVNLRVDGKDQKIRLTADEKPQPPAPQPASSVKDAWWIPLVMVVMAAVGAGAQWMWSQFGGLK